MRGADLITDYLVKAAAELRGVAEALQAPVAHTPLGAGVIPADHSLCLGAVGRNGTYPANQASRSADAGGVGRGALPPAGLSRNAI